MVALHAALLSWLPDAVFSTGTSTKCPVGFTDLSFDTWSFFSLHLSPADQSSLYPGVPALGNFSVLILSCSPPSTSPHAHTHKYTHTWAGMLLSLTVCHPELSIFTFLSASSLDCEHPSLEQRLYLISVFQVCRLVLI